MLVGKARNAPQSKKWRLHCLCIETLPKNKKQEIERLQREVDAWELEPLKELMSAENAATLAEFLRQARILGQTRKCKQ